LGAEHEHGAMAVGGRLREDTPHRDRFVIGMRVERAQGRHARQAIDGTRRPEPSPRARYLTAPASRSFATLSGSSPHSVSTSSVCCPACDGGRCTPPGVFEKRGAGAGCTTPLSSTKVPRSALCGWFGASDSESTGAKHTSVCSMISHHSSRVLVLKIAAI